MTFQFLLHGIDTVQCSYYLGLFDRPGIDWSALEIRREELRNAKRRESAPVQLGNTEFMLAPHGTKTGFPFLLRNRDFAIEMGQFNNPNFCVTFRSEALWRESAFSLHQKFLDWAKSVGYGLARPESLTRVDFCFDYYLPEIDFDEDSFKSRSAKDAQYRENGKAQTFSFGKGDIVLRVYDKVTEIKQQSGKVWFYTLWERDSEVWRIEWQIRKRYLKRFGIQTFDDLAACQGDILWHLADDHDTLRTKTSDSNSSRWPLHPLWEDLQKRIRELPHTGIIKVYGEQAELNERMRNLGQAVYGYLKRYAAIRCVQTKGPVEDFWDVIDELGKLIDDQQHEDFAWNFDVEKKRKEIELGQW